MYFVDFILRPTHVHGILIQVGHFVALTASIHSESSDSEPDEAKFDETPRQASHEHITSI